MSITPKSLLVRLRQPEDQVAWERMLTIYDPLLRGWLNALELPKTDIDDLVQNVLTVVCRKIGQFEHNGQVGAFRTWLRSIVMNCVREFWRTGRLRSADNGAPLLESLEDPHSNLSSWWDREHDRHVAQRLLLLIQAEFSPQVWEMFRLFVMESKPGNEVAELTGASLSSIYAAKSRVLARLRHEAVNLIDC